MNLSTLEQFLLQHTHGLRIALLMALLALIVFASRANAYGENGEAMTSSTTIPDEAPLSVILIESCQHTPLTMFATMSDGTVLIFDRHSGDIDIKALEAWGLRARHVLSAAAPCGGTTS